MNTRIRKLQLVQSWVLLAQRIEANKDPLSVFESLALAVIVRNTAPLKKEVIRDKLQDTFLGIGMPLDVLETVLKRLQREGKINFYEGSWKLINESLKKFDLYEDQKQVEKEVDSLISSISEYIQEKTGKKWDQERVETALIALMSHCKLDFEEIPKFEDITADNDDIRTVALFVKQTKDEQCQKWKSFVSVTEGLLIQNAVFLKIDIIKSHFIKTRLYFDTNVILSLRGAHGNQYQLAAEEMLSLLLQYQGKPYVRVETLNEVKRILRYRANCLRKPPSEDFDSTTKLLRREGIATRNFELWERVLEDWLEKTKKIHIDRKLPNEKLVHLPFPEEPIREDLLKARKERKDLHFDESVELSTDKTTDKTTDETTDEQVIKHKINLLRTIYTLRKKSIPTKLEKSVAILITEDPCLSKLANSMHKESKINGFIPVLRKYQFTSILWLKDPFRNSEAPKLLLSSLVKISVRLSEEERRNWRKEVERTLNAGEITEEEVNALYSSAAIDAVLKEQVIYNRGETPDVKTVKAKAEFVTAKELEDVKDELNESQGISHLIWAKGRILASILSGLCTLVIICLPALIGSALISRFQNHPYVGQIIFFMGIVVTIAPKIVPMWKRTIFEIIRDKLIGSPPGNVGVDESKG